MVQGFRNSVWTLLALAVFSLSSTASRGPRNELRFAIHEDPKTFDPILVEDQASETIRYLTGGVLVRLNRLSQELEPELALSWTIGDAGRTITFRLRPNVQFSDGTPFSATDVADTMRRLLDPAVHSPTADPFRSAAGAVTTQILAADRIAIHFPSPIAGLEALFDQVAIQSARSAHRDSAVLGPFLVAEYKPGVYVQLSRNPNYWKRDSQGQRLPYLDSIRLEIQQNRQMEVQHFRRGDLDLVENVDPELFTQIASESPAAAHDAGASLDAEVLWFNQSPAAPLADYEKQWFRSVNFRRAVSQAINRADLCRVVFHNLAQPAAGPVSAANRFWYNTALKPHAFDPASALRLLEHDGFRRVNGALQDAGGHAVEFSVITNAGNTARERMAAMIQQDLQAVGIHLNIVTLDFRSLIERISRTGRYESCLLGLTNTGLDPNNQMNIWLSSASNHQWSPGEKTPATPWEAEIDRLMLAQTAAAGRAVRKANFDRVQQIVREQEPFVYLVNRHALSVVSPALRNVSVTALRPQTYWNAERLRFDAGR